MIQVKPVLETHLLCPTCGQPAVVRGIVVQPVFTMVECNCEKCGFEFYQTLPIGHTTGDTLTVDKAGKKLIANHAPATWLQERLLKALAAKKEEEVDIQRTIVWRHSRVIILNALDFLYGHVLLKLYNAIHHLDHHKDLGLVVIIPKSFEWLVPSGCAEVWSVDLDLQELAGFHSSIQKFVANEFERFDEIYFSKAYSHPEFAATDIRRLTGVAPFRITNFLLLKPAFTFVLREDRWWWSSPVDYWFYRFCRRFGLLKLGSKVLSIRQDSLVKKTISAIRRKLPDSCFYVVGLGTRGSFTGYATDERSGRVDDAIEKEWCRIYARSHVVIGVHGSNMLLPTAHAAGCVEILPEDRYGNIVQDISVRYADRKQLYMYRFVEQFAHPKTVANKVISIIQHFEIFERNMCTHVYRPGQKSNGSSVAERDDAFATH